MSVIVVLDAAMEKLVRARCPEVSVVVHPTWNKDLTGGVESCVQHEPSKEVLTLFYGGNLGVSHPLDTLRRFLGVLVRDQKVRLVGVGISESGEKRLLEEMEGSEVDLVIEERVPFEELGECIREWEASFGVVLLDDETAGLVSPSKFSGYLVGSLPLLYIGPEGTNSDLICQEFGGGVSLRNGCDDKELRECAETLLEVSRYKTMRAGVVEAREFFEGKNGLTLVELLGGYFRN